MNRINVLVTMLGSRPSTPMDDFRDEFQRISVESPPNTLIKKVLEDTFSPRMPSSMGMRTVEAQIERELITRSKISLYLMATAIAIEPIRKVIQRVTESSSLSGKGFSLRTWMISWVIVMPIQLRTESAVDIIAANIPATTMPLRPMGKTVLINDGKARLELEFGNNFNAIKPIKQIMK